MTAEQVMRARYSAYATQDEDYLRRSWVAAHRPGRITFEPTLEWTGLTDIAFFVEYEEINGKPYLRSASEIPPPYPYEEAAAASGG